MFEILEKVYENFGLINHPFASCVQKFYPSIPRYHFILIILFFNIGVSRDKIILNIVTFPERTPSCEISDDYDERKIFFQKNVTWKIRDNQYELPCLTSPRTFHNSIAELWILVWCFEKISQFHVSLTTQNFQFARSHNLEISMIERVVRHILKLKNRTIRFRRLSRDSHGFISDVLPRSDRRSFSSSKTLGTSCICHR